MNIYKIALPTPFAIGDVNVYLLGDGDRLTLVDTGTKSRVGERALELGLAEVGVRVEDLSQIVLTHFHADHAGLLERLVARSGAKVYAHPLTHDLILPTEAGLQKRAAFFDEIYLRMGLVDAGPRSQIVAEVKGYQDDMGRAGVDVVLQEGDLLPGHEKWRVIYTPGHSQDHLSLYREEDGVLVLGDHLLQNISSNAFIEPPAVEGEERPKTLMIYRDALRKVYDMEWKVGLPGHFEEIREYRELIDKRFAAQEKRAARAVEAVKAGKRTGIEICQTLFPKSMNLLPLVMSETLGQLDWMTAEGKITRELNEQGVWVFR
ncbi:glyoxylase-like metal-dependent hydrolase (beta-lactamase superfamily II) [Tumebacillus sp. BK434]|uniref:MBL fold metallo-hydrolase n=1 Tax=Tumebacillus sp. BK434 TaxID=2512169 RepID=UPI00104C383A|nr:MBL fold metallo-hydrolase [Tumebacillus sp. BK434]TCP55440.1 glyoxylase-like metal-dependent hydrolase (beta-lactamase superfamily II) [Tumebacillus sp. BK434]